MIARPLALGRGVARRLALLLPPLRRLVEQRDAYARREGERESLAAHCETLEARVAMLEREIVAGELDQAGRPGDVDGPGSRVEGEPSILFVSLPKSGTIYTWHSLQAATGLRVPPFRHLRGWDEYERGLDFSCPALCACGDYNTQLLIPHAIRHYLRGFVFGTHIQASYHNMRVLKDAGFRRIVVLLRDPRDAFVSWVHHLRELGPSARDYHSKIYHVPRAYYGWPLAKQFEFQTRTFLPVTVNWVEGWLDYYASDDKGVEVLFVYYDELKREPVRYLRRIAGFLGLQNVDYSRVEPPEPGKLHFRKGQHGQWREDFAPRDQKLADELMGDRILDGFEAAARRHPGFAAATARLQAGALGGAAAEALEVVSAFPNHRASYELLMRAAEGAGASVTGLRTLVERELASPSIAGAFIYRYELVDAARELVSRL